MCVMHACVAQYVNLDDCWMEARDNLTGHILPFADKFPSGMKALGDYIHSLGLKFGVYSGAGSWHTPHTSNPAAPRTLAKHHVQATRRVRTGQAQQGTRSRMRSTTRRGASTMSSMTFAAWRARRSRRATVRCCPAACSYQRCSPRAALVPEACARSTRRRLRADARRAQRERPADDLLDRLVGQGRAAPLARAGAHGAAG